MKGFSPFTSSQAEQDMKSLKAKYAQLDDSNPYANMENKFEDLTVNQKQYQIDKEKFGSNQANVLESVRESGANASNVAQVLSEEGKKASQESSAKVGKQEKENQDLKAEEAAKLQKKERDGEIISRNMKKEKTSTLLGMSQQELAAEREKKATAEQASWDVLASGVSTVGSALTQKDEPKKKKYPEGKPRYWKNLKYKITKNPKHLKK